MSELSKEGDGEIVAIDGSGTTMWQENTINCPNNKDHELTGSSRKIYCHECGIFWVRK